MCVPAPHPSCIAADRLFPYSGLVVNCKIMVRAV